MIYKLVFGMTVKQWGAQNPNLHGNMRDHASVVQNILIANLENLNSFFIRKGASAEAREKARAETVDHQLSILNEKYLPE